MNAIRESSLDTKMRAAIADLKRMITARYPTAAFEVSRGVDEPRAIHLTAIVDLDDPGEVLDLVIDRVVDLQVDEGIPLHVIPMHTPERVLAQVEARERRRASKDVSATDKSQPINR